jgi:hypothetical protein
LIIQPGPQVLDVVAAHRVADFWKTPRRTPLMQPMQTIGIDLPLKALVWLDASGSTWLSYNDPSWVAKRHGLGHEAEVVVSAMAPVLEAMSGALSLVSVAAPG